jgi:CheY-like chemotaxis protein
MEWARDMIDRQVGQLVRLVDDLLDVSRISRGKIVLKKAVVALAEVVDLAVESCRPLLEARRHDLAVELPVERVWLEADATRLAQVLANLLNNAAKYTEEGGRVRLTAERRGDEVVLRVSDNGLGIDPPMLPRIFEPFAQADNTLARSEGGLGIGLTLARSLVELHGGTIEAHSEGLGKGSEFVVCLPVPQDVGQPSANGRPAEAGPVAAPRRILVVDDNGDAAESLALLLDSLGHDVRTARDGQAAVAMAAVFQPEVVLLDIGLPRLDGYEVARRLRGLLGLKETLLVALTGYGQEEDRRRAEEAGFNSHLVKPADVAALQSLLAGVAPAESITAAHR